MLKIIHVSAECFPIAKVGGLADVVGALPKYQKGLGFDTEVMMPFYNNTFTSNHNLEIVFESEVFLSENRFIYKVYELEESVIGFHLFIFKIDELMDREKVYGYPDDPERFFTFQLAVLDFILKTERNPDVIHCHDHHTSFIPFFTSYCYQYEILKSIPTVLTIHNAQYQGEFEYDKFHYFPEFNHEHSGIIDWYGKINPLATAIKCAWKVTTVSPSYLIELQKKANGLEGLLSHETNKCLGILNGIDKQVWDMTTDSMLVSNYNLKTVAKGRQGNKEWICKEFDLDINKPLIAFIGRFVYEKGSNLLPDVIKNVFDNLQQEVSLLVLGSGDPNTTQELEELKERYKNRYNCYIGYNEKLSHIIYGGADFLLMPSRIEPCGLNQMYAMRYGMIPIVSKTGGLKDTVIDLDEGESGFGIICNEVSVHEISFSIQRAVHVYENPSFFKEKRLQIMKIENGWGKSAKEYTNMYKSLITT